MSDNEILEVIKRGETSLTVSLVRSISGLTIAVKTHPAVEAFIRGLGSGESTDVKAGGPYWRLISREAPPLRIYTVTESVNPIVLDNGEQVTIGRPGYPIIEAGTDSSGRTRQIINLSFLRLVGISEGAGITFVLRGVHTYEAVAAMKEKIGEGYKRFYLTYMKPLKMDIVVSTQETML